MEYHPIPQPEEISVREREDAMGAYFMMFATMALGLPLPVINLIASIVYFFVNRERGRFVQFHTLQSLYSQLPVTALNMGLIIWIFRNVVNEFNYESHFWGYAVLVALANLIYFSFSIVGAVKAHKGRFYYFLFFGKMAYHTVYKVRQSHESQDKINTAPKM